MYRLWVSVGGLCQYQSGLERERMSQRRWKGYQWKTIRYNLHSWPVSEVQESGWEGIHFFFTSALVVLMADKSQSPSLWSVCTISVTLFIFAASCKYFNSFHCVFISLSHTDDAVVKTQPNTTNSIHTYTHTHLRHPKQLLCQGEWA